MTKKIDYINLSANEKDLLQRFEKILSSNPNNAVKSILELYQDQVFFKDIFQIVVEDVCTVLSINEFNNSIHDKVCRCAELLYNKSGGFFYAGEHFLFALPIIWISYCTNYKGKGYVFSLDEKTRGLKGNKLNAQISISSQFFNMFAGPMESKSTLFELYMLKNYGAKCRDSSQNNDNAENFKALLKLLSLTGFSYEGPFVI